MFKLRSLEARPKQLPSDPCADGALERGEACDSRGNATGCPASLELTGDIRGDFRDGGESSSRSLSTYLLRLSSPTGTRFTGVMVYLRILKSE